MTSSDVQPFFDDATSTWSYVLLDSSTRQCAVIDSVLDFDPASGRISTESAREIIDFIERHELQLVYLLETHVHADHLSASHFLKTRIGGEIAIGDQVGRVQQTFGPMFNAGPTFATDGRQFDHLLPDGAHLTLGALDISVMHTPGHTPACVTYLVDGKAFVGDTLFMPDYGTARTDFPGGDAGTLFDSIQRILSLPDDTELLMCHDYLPADRSDYRYRTSVAEERGDNVHLAGTSKEAFIEARQARDRALPAPRLLLPSIQVNMRAGELPPPEDNEMRYLKIPLRVEMA